MDGNRFRFTLWVARIAAAGLIAACLAGWTPSPLLAQSPALDDADTCVSCHQEESAAWEVSPHGSVDPESAGQAGGASCVDCHGEYVKGHPAEGPMSLSVDSSSCQECHASAFAQWDDSHHASEGVQCISCHKPHSQQLRLTDESLCRSCHHASLDDPFHTAHWQGDVTCTACHLADAPTVQMVASQDPAMGVTAAPSHDFITVSGQNCLDCHREAVTITQTVPTKSVAEQTTPAGNVSIRRAERGSATLSAANLGFGLGIGGILGIVFMLVAGSHGWGRK